MNFDKREIVTKSGQKRIEVRYWNGTGDKRVEIKRRFRSVKEANAFIDCSLNDLAAERMSAKCEAADPMDVLTFADEFEAWKAYKTSEWSPSYRVAVAQYYRDLKDGIAHLKIRAVVPKVLRDIEVTLRSRGDAAETIRHKLGMIKAVLNHSAEMERISYSPIAQYKLPKRKATDIEFWETHEVMSFLDFAQAKYAAGSPGYMNFVAYMVALNTGVRAGELWALRVQGIRPTLNAIQVTEQYHAVSKTFRHLKGKQGRLVPLNPGLLAVLMQWIQHRGLKAQDLLFTNQAGNPIDHNNFYDRVFLRDVKEWGGRLIKFHGLRHTAATLMLDQGVNIRTLQKILGHKDLETTERYVHTLGRTIQEAAEKFALMPSFLFADPDPAEPPSNAKGSHLSIVS